MTGREGSQERCVALWVAKGSQVKINMILLWPLEAWPKLFVS